MKNFATLAALFAALMSLTMQSASAQAAPAKPAHHMMGAAASTGPVVVMQTVRGTIVIKLFPKDAPLSCANFTDLVKKGFYNGLTFHRITSLDPNTPSKIVQGGDPNGDGSGGYKNPKTGQERDIKGEFSSNGVNNPLTHVAGAFAMARSNDNDSASSQFYICVNAVHFLDGKYAVFGQVIKGLDVADKLQIGDKMTKVYLSKAH